MKRIKLIINDLKKMNRNNKIEMFYIFIQLICFMLSITFVVIAMVTNDLYQSLMLLCCALLSSISFVNLCFREVSAKISKLNLDLLELQLDTINSNTLNDLENSKIISYQNLIIGLITMSHDEKNSANLVKNALKHKDELDELIKEYTDKISNDNGKDSK